MILDLGPIIDQEAVSVTLRSKSGGAWNDDGEWAGETTADTAILAVVQPATGQKLQDLPEGERNDAEFFLWTRSDLALDDLILYAGKTHRVIHRWPRPEGGFTRAAIGRLRAN